MAPKMKNRISPCRKLLMLRALSNSKSVKNDSIILDSIFHILQLKLEIEAMKREISTIMQLIQRPQEVKVERTGNTYMVRVTCEQGKDKLVSVLEAFEEMGLAVLHAKVSSNPFFSMEAVAVAHEHGQNTHSVTTLNVRDVTQALYNAIGKKSMEEACG